MRARVVANTFLSDFNMNYIQCKQETQNENDTFSNITTNFCFYNFF